MYQSDARRPSTATNNSAGSTTTSNSDGNTTTNPVPKPSSPKASPISRKVETKRNYSLRMVTVCCFGFLLLGALVGFLPTFFALKSQLDEKDSELKKNNVQKLTAKDTEIKLLKTEGETKDKKNTELEKKNTELEKKNTELESKNTQLESKNTQLEAKITTLENEAKTKDKKIDGLEDKAQSQTGVIEELQKRVKTKTSRIRRQAKVIFGEFDNWNGEDVEAFEAIIKRMGSDEEKKIAHVAKFLPAQHKALAQCLKEGNICMTEELQEKLRDAMVEKLKKERTSWFSTDKSGLQRVVSFIESKKATTRNSISRDEDEKTFRSPNFKSYYTVYQNIEDLSKSFETIKNDLL